MKTRLDYIQEDSQSHLDFKNYTTLNNTLHYTTLCSNMTSRKKKGQFHRKCGNVLKFSHGDIVRVLSQNLKNHCKFFV